MSLKNKENRDKEDHLIEPKFRQKEAAQYLGLSVAQLSRLTTARRVGCYRLSSGAVAYGRKHLETFLQASEQKAIGS